MITQSEYSSPLSGANIVGTLTSCRNSLPNPSSLVSTEKSSAASLRSLARLSAPDERSQALLKGEHARGRELDPSPGVLLPDELLFRTAARSYLFETRTSQEPRGKYLSFSPVALSVLSFQHRRHVRLLECHARPSDVKEPEHSHGETASHQQSDEKTTPEVNGSSVNDSDAESFTKDAQDGVRKIEATTSVSTMSNLIMAYISYVLDIALSTTYLLTLSTASGTSTSSAQCSKA
jgi:hypothetical protein